MGKTADLGTPELDTPFHRRMVVERKSPEEPKWWRRFARVAGAAALSLCLAVLAACTSATPEPTPTPTPTPAITLTLTPASLTLEQAARFLAGGETMSEENLQERFAGRVFKDEKTGATIVLSEAAKDSLLSQIPADKLPGMSVEEIQQELAKLMEGSEWGQIFRKYTSSENLKNHLISAADFTRVDQRYTVVFGEEGKVFVFGPGFVRFDAKYGDRGGCVLTSEGRINLPQWVKDEFKAWLNRRGLQILWHEGLGNMVITDEYQVLSFFERRQGQQSITYWQKVFPHERKNGEYELLTPQQRMIKAMADLKSVTGYDGSGVWTEGEPTVVDYTDSQGAKHHQELKVHLIHESQDPNSPVVYEVLEDPNTGEMMFTIRKAKDNEQNIQGLNEQQAQLVRQAWAYLLSADPAVMEKFWRVNRTMGVGVRYIPNLASTNWLVDGNIGLIILRNDFSALEGPCILISGESYELYAAQFGWRDQYRYVNIPPDAVNKNALLDAVLRKKLWFEKYGSSLPNFLKKAFVDSIAFVSKYFEETTGSEPIQPQIPFEP